MRFFKAFNLLHRRTKSATFVPGTGPLRTSMGTRDRNQPASPTQTYYNPPVFDLATAQQGPVPSYFDYHHHANHRAMSLGSIHPSANKTKHAMGHPNHLSMDPMPMAHHEQVSLYWFQEHAKARESLELCLRDLNTEKHKITILESKIEQDAVTIAELHKELQRYKGYVDGINLTLRGPRGNEGPMRELLNLPTADAIAEFALNSQIRTLDDYSAALRMTLTTRRELRDQKKLTKYWKSKTRDSVSLAAAEGIPVIQPITPSVSAISSVHEALPKERQAALDKLIARRGLTSTLAYLKEDVSIDTPSNTLVLDSDFDDDKAASSSQDVLSSLPSRTPSGLSKSASRLGPLASESFRAQVDEFFGIKKSFNGKAPQSSRSSHSSLSSLSELPPAFPSSANASWMKTARSMKSDQSFKIESFGDLGVIFRTAFGESAEEDFFTSPLTYGAITQSSMNIRPLSIHDGAPKHVQQDKAKQTRRASTSSSTSPSPWKRYLERNISQQELQRIADPIEEGLVHPHKKTGSGESNFALPFFKKRASSGTSSKASTRSQIQNEAELEIYAI
ncbi:hypothetical protein CVT24_005754 [Panaeolus cyanescens]|uniref:Uncharacterized protein n=1 Tax=Panaeolus cyanescens TaxID=181874 RepID=A0A409VBB5_9AGAR|nr:hypothetical protein CVT24_005754 [Panaeolus cyanescens]